MSKPSKLSTKELFTIALAVPLDDLNSDESWGAVNELGKRGTRKIYQKARKLCHSRKANKREVGVNILYRLGDSKKPSFRKKRLRLFLSMTETESSPLVLCSLINALGHLIKRRANRAMLRFSHHAESEVRLAIAISIDTYDYDYERIVDTLIELSQDSDPFIRNYATYRLGILDFGSHASREALYARLSDLDDGARGEALCGLVRLKDQRVFAPLLAQLEKMPDDILDWRLPLEATEALADMRLLPALYKLRDDWAGEQGGIYRQLEDAIAACEGKQTEN